MATLTFMNHTIFDHGASSKLGQVLALHGIRKPLLCTDRGLVDLGMVDALAANLGTTRPSRFSMGHLKTLLRWLLKMRSLNI